MLGVIYEISESDIVEINDTGKFQHKFEDSYKILRI
jgi:hypothetical protein